MPHAHHLFKLDLDLPVDFSHLKKNLPCRDKTKSVNKSEVKAGERRESDEIFPIIQPEPPRANKSIKTDHAATENRRRVYGHNGTTVMMREVIIVTK